MDLQGWAGLVVLILLLALAASAGRRQRGRRRSSPGTGAMGSVYDLLSQDRRNAIEMIVENKAAARDPEDADGNLPDLERPKRLP